MANSKSAEKRHAQSLVRRQRNRSYRARMRTAIKKLRQAAKAGDGDQARELLGPTLKLVDATRQKGVIHPNAAARRKSRLTKLVQKLG